MKKRKTLIMMLSLVCLLVVGIGFAAISKINLVVTGNVNLTPNENAFAVVFSEGSKTAGNGTGTADTITVAGNTATATLNVNSLQAKNSFVTYTLTIKNTSSDTIDAVVSKPVIAETDSASAFTVTTDWGDTASIVLAQNETKVVEITVTLNIAPIDNVTGTFTVTFEANPQLAAA